MVTVDPELSDTCGGPFNTYNIVRYVIFKFIIMYYNTQAPNFNSYLLKSRDENDMAVFECFYTIQVRVRYLH